ncbi:MAG TPA: class III poly(R)-hydroxyalkanoic acid synthase subunit PhaE [Stenotrophomonas sp.]
MTGNGGGQNQDLEALARQYWDTWSESLRQAGTTGAAGMGAGPGTMSQDWSKALGGWRSVLGDAAPDGARESVDRFSGQAGDWLGLMQQVAARFAGRDTNSEEVANAWRQSVESQRDQLLQWTLGALRGGVAGGFDPWLAQAASQWEQWQRDSAPWLQMPGLGLGRNHHVRWQAFNLAHQEYQARSQAYVEQLRTALDRAFGVFQAKLSEHETLGSQLTSARALFDLWIEAAEEAYSAVALSEEFRDIYGAYANAHMRLRAAMQQEVEQVAGQYGMPTRSEMDAAHKKIAELERLVRRMATARGQAPVADVAPRARAAKSATAKTPGDARRAASAGTAKAAKAAPKPAGSGKGRSR